MLAQKIALSAPNVEAAGNVPAVPDPVKSAMDLGILAALAMLVVWAVGTFVFEGPGWIHALLTAGVFLLIWRIVVRGTPAPRRPGGRDR